jgi:serine protease AprX
MELRMRKIAKVLRSSMVACALVATAASAGAQTLTSGKLDPLLQLRTSSLTGRSRVVVRAANASSLPMLTLLIQQLGGEAGRALPIIDAVAADVPNAALSVLAGNSLVRRVALDRVVRGSMERTSATSGATSVRHELGYDGSGIGVAVIDSGVTAWHDDLTQAGVPGSQRIDQFVDFVNGRHSPYDDYGHGTHVAGIIAGNGFDSGGAGAGIAPGVRLVVLKVLDANGRGRMSDVIAALDYVVSHQAAFNTRIINLSIGAGVFESYNSDLLTVAAKEAVDRGIIVVASAGNAGRNSQGRTVYGGITAPGNAPWVLTVGASSTQGTIDRSDDVMAAFSSRGPTAVDRAAKPDVVAPGVGTASLSAPESTLFTTKSPYLIHGTVPTPYLPYFVLSGTSQAAPVVAGTVALMLQANPTLTPNAVKAILQYTAQTYDGYDALTQGAGFLNTRGAVDLARFFKSPLTVPLPSDTRWSRQLLWGTHRLKGGLITASASAWGRDVSWGAGRTAAGSPVTWGVLCDPDCTQPTPDTWATICVSPDCGVAIWGDVTSENVVWGWICGGADCNFAGITPVWAPAASGTGTVGPTSSNEDTVVWGTANEDTVVWGTADDGDTVVWGTADDGDTVVWGTADDGDTVVWGTSDDGDTVVWGTSDEGDTVVWGTSDECDSVVWDTSGDQFVESDRSCEATQLAVI